MRNLELKFFTINLKAMARQFAAAKTGNNWVLSLDADEILNDELIAAIIKAIQQNKGDIVAYFIKDNMFFE
jgi:glycosyltransferase involved in cell wall biosynthesis